MNLDRNTKATALRIKAITLILVMVFDVLFASVVSASQNIHLPDVSSLKNTINISRANPPCHDGGDLIHSGGQVRELSSGNLNDIEADTQVDDRVARKTESSSDRDNQTSMPCCDDDCSHCPSVVSFIKSSVSRILIFKTKISLEAPKIIPAVNGYPLSIYRPPAFA